MNIVPIDCAWCAVRCTTWNRIEGSGLPRPSDFALCAVCYGLNRFTDGYTLRRATDDERHRFETDRADELEEARRLAPPEVRRSLPI